MISPDLSAIEATSLLTEFVLSLITDALLATSSIVADNSSVRAERSEALSLEVRTLSKHFAYYLVHTVGVTADNTENMLQLFHKSIDTSGKRGNPRHWK